MKQINIFLKKYWPLLAYLLISIIFLFPTLCQQGIPFKYDWAWPVYSMTEFWRGIANSGTLGIGSIIGKYPAAILGLFGLIGIPPEIMLKIFLVSVHTAAGYGFYRFVNEKTNNKFISFITGIAYAFTPYIFIRTIIGFIYSMIAVAALPFFLSSYLSPKKKLWQYLITGFLFILVFSQFQAGVLTLLLIFINLVLTFSKKSVKNFFLTLLAMVALLLPWYLVITFFGQGTATPVGTEATTLNFIAALPHSLRNVLTLSDHHITNEYFYPFVRGQLMTICFGLIYLVATFSIFDRKNRSFVWSLIITSMLVIPFSIGPTGRFVALYTYFFQHIPQMALFRETYHFQFILAFALICLFALGLNKIFDWFPLGRFGSIIVRGLASAMILIIISPYFNFDFAGYFHLQPIPTEYKEASGFLTTNQGFCTKAYYPPNLGFIYFKDDNSRDALNSDILAQSFGVAYLSDGSSVLNLPSEEMFFRNKLTSQFLEKRDNGEVANLMAEGGIDCLIVRDDLDTKYSKVSNLWLEPDQKIKDKWLNNDMLRLAKSKKGLKLEKQFGDEIFIYKVVSAQIVNTDGAQIENIPEGIQSPITNWATKYDNFRQGWSRGRYAFWRKKIFADLGQDFIYTNKSDAVLSGTIEQAGEYQLLVRYLEGGQSGNFKFQISNAKYEIQKQPGEERFVVKDLGKVSVKKGDIVEIANISGENAIADLLLK